MITKRNYLLPFLLLSVALTVLLFTWSCEKEDPVELAILTTVNVTEITPNGAKSGGNITGDGGDDIIARGVCWGTSPGPTINDNKTTDGKGTGSYTSSLTGLSRNSGYYVRAYATNSAGTSYGNEVQFTTGGEPATVTTSIVADIGSVSAQGGGNITDDGGISITAKGVVWSSSENPTLDDNEGFTEDGTGTGVFTSDITDLMTEKTYYVRAYATNSVGTVYGEQESFETVFISGEPYADQRDGNVYNTVQIGNQVWLKENLRYLPQVSPSTVGSQTDPYYYVYDYQGTNVSAAMATDNYRNYGVLYNWPASLNACPAGWHLPSDTKWTQLTNYLVDEYGLTNNWDDVNGLANKLKSCRQVNSTLGGDCSTTNHPRWNSDYTHYGNDEFGFSALPGGKRYVHIDIGFGSIYYIGYWWSSSEAGSSIAWNREITYAAGSVGRHVETKDTGISVRCVRD